MELGFAMSFIPSSLTKFCQCPDPYAPPPTHSFLKSQQEKQHWLRALTGIPNEGITTFLTMSPLKKALIQSEYLTTHQRMTPFFVGMVLYFAYKNSSAVKASGVSILRKAFHYLCFVFSIFTFLGPALLGFTKLQMRAASEGPSFLTVFPIL